MPELGKYAGAVLGSWGVTLLLLAGLVAMTWLQSRAAKRKHDEIEARRGTKES
ncbi:MAG: heme exporter protein CcmD [Maritimibacter sp.]|nr:heme exporter protein CcmD [Maritimibacter sp.]